MEKNLFGATMGTLRRRKRMTQEKLGQIIGITRACVCFYERGARTPDLNMAVRIAAILGSSLDDMVAGRIRAENG